MSDETNDCEKNLKKKNKTVRQLQNTLLKNNKDIHENDKRMKEKIKNYEQKLKMKDKEAVKYKELSMLLTDELIKMQNDSEKPQRKKASSKKGGGIKSKKEKSKKRKSKKRKSNKRKSKKRKRIKSKGKVNIIDSDYKNIGKDRYFTFMKIQDKIDYLTDIIPDLEKKLPIIIEDIIEDTLQKQVTIFLFGKEIKVLDPDIQPNEIMNQLKQFGEVGDNIIVRIENEKKKITNELIWKNILDYTTTKMINMGTLKIGNQLIDMPEKNETIIRKNC